MLACIASKLPQLPVVMCATNTVEKHNLQPEKEFLRMQLRAASSKMASVID